MIRLLLILLLFPFFTSAQTVTYRKYKAGETFRYKLTTETYNNEKYTGKTISISEHRVIPTTNFLSEEIRWINKLSINGKDTILLDSIAQRVNPYGISLSPKGDVSLPKLSIPEMVGEITDLNTFWVAISPALNAHHLSLKDSVYKNDKPSEGDFTDSIRILYGKDCITVTQYLISTNKKYTVIKTDFTAPPSFCLTPLLDTIAQKTFGSPNNFQMIQKGNGDKVNLLWGVESFTITTTINNKNGQILNAAMENILRLRMRYNASKDLKTYDAEFPVSIKRYLKLELLK